MSKMGICDACDALDLVKPEPFAPFFGPRRNLCPPCWKAADNWEPSDAALHGIADDVLERERSGDGMSEATRQRCRDAGRGNQVGR